MRVHIYTFTHPALAARSNHGDLVQLQLHKVNPGARLLLGSCTFGSLHLRPLLANLRTSVQPTGTGWIDACVDQWGWPTTYTLSFIGRRVHAELQLLSPSPTPLDQHYWHLHVSDFQLVLKIHCVPNTFQSQPWMGWGWLRAWFSSS